MSCVIKYKGLSIPEENFIEHLQKLISINDMFDNLEGFADGVYEDLGFNETDFEPKLKTNPVRIGARFPKDQIKANYADGIIAYGTHSTGKYAEAFGGTRTSFKEGEVIMISVNGNNRPNQKENVEKTKRAIDQAISQGVSAFIADNKIVANSSHNSGGEGVIREYLLSKGLIYKDFKGVGLYIVPKQSVTNLPTSDQTINIYAGANQNAFERKQKAIQIYSRYITEDVEGVGIKNWIKGIKTLDYQSELLNLNDSDEILYQKQIDSQAEQDDYFLNLNVFNFAEVNIEEAKKIITNSFINATEEEAKLIYRKFAIQYHPDKGGSEELMKHLNDIYDKFKKGKLQKEKEKIDREAVRKFYESVKTNLKNHRAFVHERGRTVQDTKIKYLHDIKLTPQDFIGGILSGRGYFTVGNFIRFAQENPHLLDEDSLEILNNISKAHVYEERNPYASAETGRYTSIGSSPIRIGNPSDFSSVNSLGAVFVKKSSTKGYADISEIHINPAYFDIAFFENNLNNDKFREFVETIGHELIHKLTTPDLLSDNVTRKEIEEIYIAAKEAYKTYTGVKNNITDYALSNLAEFTANYFNSKEFKDFLKTVTVKSQNNKKQSLLDKLITAIARFFNKNYGITEKNAYDYLTKVINNNTFYGIPNKVFVRKADYSAVNESKKQNEEVQNIENEIEQFNSFQQSLNNPNTNPLLQGNHEEQVKKFNELQERLNNKEFLEGAKNAYESTPELQQFGTQEQYNDYIARVSLGIIKNPSNGKYNYESKVKDILYHGTMEQSLPKDGKFKGYITYLTDNKRYAETFGFPINRKIINVVANITNPYNASSELADVPKEIHDSNEFTNPRIIKQNKSGYDSVLGIDAGQKEGRTIAVFEPEQIHILGSKQDIEGFREFINNVKNNHEDVSEYDKYFGDVISDENVTDQNDNNLQDTFLQKENESKLPSNKELNKMMQIFLEKIGVRINAVDHIKDASGKKLNAIAKADIMSKIIDVVQGKADITTLPEEAGHFFVELLPSNSPLLHEMMNKITSYKIYGQVYEQYKKVYTLPDGSPDFVKIKKEAIGKLIAQHIIKDFKGSESDSKLTSIKNWFRKVIDYVLSILHKAGFVVENPFEQVAKQILAADTTGLNQEASVRSELYQLDPDGNTDAEVEDVIDVSSAENKLMEDQSKIVLDNSIDPVTKQKRHVYTYEGKKVKSSVTQKYVDPWIKKIYNTDTRSEIQKIIDLEKAHYGDLSHEEMQGIVSSWTNPDGTLKSEQGPHQIVTNKTVYDKLNNLFQQIASQYPEGTKFKAEVKIYDKMADVAGSIDLLVIQPNGIVDIYDWKTQEIPKDQTELKWYKEKMYQIQLENYRKILEMEYGFVKFGKIRAIPIATKFQYSKKGILRLLDIEVGDIDPRNIPDEKSYLLPVTLMGESTGNDMLDEFIRKLEGIYKKIEAVRYKNEEYYKRIEELAKIKTSIRDIRLRGDINKFIDLGIIEYNKFKKKLDNGELTGRDLLEAQRIMKVFEDSGKCLGELLKEYKKAAEESKDPDALKNYEKTRNRLFNMSQSASTLLVEMVKYNNKQSEQLAQKEGIFNLLKPEAPIGALNGLMTALSGITHKSFRLFSNLLRFEQNKRDVEFKNYVEESEKMKKKFLDYCKKKGITPIKAMNMLLDIDENGNWSGNFIRKYKKEFSKEREQALRKGDVKWFIDNVVYDEELHQKYLEAEKKITELYNSIVYSLDEETQKKEVEKRIKLWKETYQVIKDDETLNYQALMNPSNRFVRPVDKWLTEEWKEIHNNEENAPLKEIYEFFQKTIRKAEELGMLDGYNPRFIPSIYASKLDHLVFGDISKLFSSEGFFENLQVDAGNQYTPEIDPVDGTIINRIPVYFTNDIGVKREDGTMDYSKKSRDLFKVFTVFAAHMYNYEAMSNLEDSALMLLEAERNKKSLVTDNFGNLVFENGMVKVIDSNDKNAKMLEDFVNFYLYDRISGAGADAKFKLFGKEYSVLKSVRQAMSFFSLKTLGLNPISGTAQFVGGTGNALFTAQKGIMFTKTQWVRGVYRCVSSKKAKAAIKYFDARLEGTKNYDINDASLSKANSILNADTAFFIQRKSDAAVQDPILLALMENHMLTEDGRIVKIDTYVKEKYDYNNSFYNKSNSERKEIRKKIEAEVKELQETKSLFAIGKIDDEGKFYIPGLDKKSKEFSKFKDKVKAVSKTIIGNSSHDDINRIRTTVLGMALMQFRNWIPAMVAERTGKFKYNDALETYTIGKFNLFLSEMFSSRFPSLIKSLLLGFGTDGIAAAKAKYQEMKRKAYEKGEEWTITEGEFIDLYIGSLRSQMLELIVILSFVGLMFALFSSGDDDDKPRDGFLMYLSRAMDKYKQEFLFYYDPREFTNLVRTPIPVVGLLEDFYRFVGAFAKQSAGVITSNEEMMDKAKPGKYFLRMVPGFNPALVLMAAYDDEFRKEWGIKVTIN